MIRKLRSKFIWINMILVSLMLIVIFCLILGFTRSALERESLAMMESIGSSPMGLLKPEEPGNGFHLPYFVLRIDPVGNILAVGGGYYDLSDREFLTEVLMLAAEAGTESGVIGKYDLRFLWMDSISGTRVVFADLSSQRATLTNLMQICLLVGGVSFLAFLGLSVYLAKWAVKPVEHAWEQQKQFIADASHELKTPLTVILTNAELMQSPEIAPEEYDRYAGSVLQTARQMRLLVERLLTLARMDNNASNMVMERLDFSGLTQACILSFEPVFFERGLTLQSNLAPGICVTGSREHLRQVLDILLDNGGKYSDVPGDVWVYLKRQGNRCLLAVSNPGPPLAREDLERIFERFYRVDKARSRDGSCGLGLPIARSIASQHGGKLRAESAGGYNTFFLELPMDQNGGFSGENGGEKPGNL